MLVLGKALALWQMILQCSAAFTTPQRQTYDRLLLQAQTCRLGYTAEVLNAVNLLEIDILF